MSVLLERKMRSDGRELSLEVNDHGSIAVRIADETGKWGTTIDLDIADFHEFLDEFFCTACEKENSLAARINGRYPEEGGV